MTSWNPEIYCVNKIQRCLALQQVVTIYRMEQNPLNSRGKILNIESPGTFAPPCLVNTAFYVQDLKFIKFASTERGRQWPATSRCPRTVQLRSQWSPKGRRTLVRSSGCRHVKWSCSEPQKTVCGSRDAPVPGTLFQTHPSITPPSLEAARIPKRLHPATIIWQVFLYSPSIWL